MLIRRVLSLLVAVALAFPAYAIERQQHNRFSGLTVSGAALFADGTAGAPSIAFSSDADGTGTGIYRDGANSLTIANNGTASVRISQSGNLSLLRSGTQIYAQDGAVGAPSYGFFNDTDTGIYTDGANQLAFTTGGTQRARFLATGTFQMRSSGVFEGSAGSAAAPSLILNSDSNTGFYHAAADNWRMSTNGTDLISFASSGVFLLKEEFYLPDGQNVAPSLTYANDPDAGIYRVGVNEIGFVAGGAATFTVKTDRLAMAVSGTAAVPAITLNDADTGFYRVGADQIGVSAGGALVASFDSDSFDILGGNDLRLGEADGSNIFMGGSGGIFQASLQTKSVTIAGGPTAAASNGAYLVLHGDDFGGGDLGPGADLNMGDNSAATFDIIHNATTVATVNSGGLDITGELSVTGLPTDSGVICRKADGDLGQCTSAVGAGGTCTCA